VHRLCEHTVFVDRQELPESFRVHLVGDFHWQDAGQLARVRRQAESPDADGGWAIHALGLVGDREAVPLARKLLGSPNIFTRFSAARALVQLGQTQEGINALHKLTDARDDVTGCYRYCSAEILYRLGHRDAIEVLIALMESNIRAGYIDGPLEILEDLTGQYFLTAAEWRRWLNQEKQPKR
jgi:HEAT repeat protein